MSEPTDGKRPTADCTQAQETNSTIKLVSIANQRLTPHKIMLTSVVQFMHASGFVLVEKSLALPLKQPSRQNV